MKATLFLILATLFWGFNFHFAKYMLSESSFIEAAGWRYVFGVGTLLLFGFKALKSLKWRQIPIKGIFLVGVIGLFFFNVFFFKGLEYTDPINAALIVGLNPLWTLLFSAFLIGTKITRYHVIGALLSLIGVTYLLTQGSLENLKSLNFNRGDLLILSGVIVFALQNVWVKIYQGTISNFNFTTLTNALCLLGFLCILPWDQNSLSWHHSTWYWISSIGIGAFGTAAAYLFWNLGIVEKGPDRAGIYLNVVPLAAAISGLAIGEPLYTHHFVSGMIIISGVLITQYAGRVKEAGSS